MATLKLLAPAAFAKGGHYPDLCALEDAEEGLVTMVTILIDLQLFHLHRAAKLTAVRRSELLTSSSSNCTCITGHEHCSSDTASPSTL